MPKSMRQSVLSPRRSAPPLARGALHVALVVALWAFAAPAQAAPAKEREAAAAEKLYRELGSSMFCKCGGCRERLLECSMVNCQFKETATRFLREECRDAEKSPDQIRAAMIERFGPEIMQVHQDSLLYPVLFGAAFLTLAVFGVALWFFGARGRSEEPPPAPPKGDDPALEQRILREMEELE